MKNKPPANSLSGYLKSLLAQSAILKNTVTDVSNKHICPVCIQPGKQQPLCNGCLDDLVRLIRPHMEYCPLCARYSAGGTPCGQCQTQPPPQQAMYAVCRYQPPLSRLIYHYKFLGDIHLHAPLAQLLINHPTPWPQQPQALLAMPLSRPRLHQRGFNQSLLLAQALAEHLNLPIIPQNTIERKHRPPQSTLPEKARYANINGIFTVNRPDTLYGRRILLIDDVTTTGATFSELAQTLLLAGASAVYCLALAKPD